MDRPTVGQHDFVVRSNEPVAEGVCRMSIESDVAVSIRPGQFMNLSVPGDSAHILRIPLSFARSDAGECTVELEYAVVGEGTRRLQAMRPGDASVLTGPCGRGWWVDEHAEGMRALLVAGGIGLPPIEAAAAMLAQAQVPFDVVVGARTASALIEDRVAWLREMTGVDGQVIVCTDDGSAGQVGFTTTAAEQLVKGHKLRYTHAYACGPTPMLAGVTRLAQEQGMSCQVSMERMMGCGFGACSCCNVPLVRGGYALCCQDGPVFDAREVAW